MVWNRVILDEISMEIALSFINKAMDMCMTGERITRLNLEVIRIFQILTLFTGERSEPEK